MVKSIQRQGTGGVVPVLRFTKAQYDWDITTTSVTDMTPTAANAFVESARFQYAVPAEERTKQAAEETKRAAEETKREAEVTKREETLAKHQTFRHIFVFAAVIAGLGVVALRENSGASVAALVAVLGGIYVVDRAIDRWKSKALPKGEEPKQLE
ncbi:hypothetical protein WME75_35305 [Sorangium sp. So ce1014]|uniref:hypothetical protein n=1 Tax=Sorangium sp. So ce1014 TaxID=3133326 RepID=UPI003F62C781